MTNRSLPARIGMETASILLSILLSPFVLAIALLTSPFVVVGFICGIVWTPMKAGFLVADNIWNWFLPGKIPHD